MDDEQRKQKKKIILSYIGALAQPAKLYAIANSGNPLIDKYYQGITKVKNSTTIEEDKQGWDLIIEAFIDALHIAPDIELKANLSPIEFEENLDTIFKSIGITKGIEDVLDYQEGRNQGVGIIIAQAIMKEPTPKKEKSNFKPKESSATSTEKQPINIFSLQITELPRTVCSEELISKLSRKYNFVYELLVTSYDELIWNISDESTLPIRFLVELEYFFRTYHVDFLDTIRQPTFPKDITAINIIKETVSVALRKTNEQKKETLK